MVDHRSWMLVDGWWMVDGGSGWRMIYRGCSMVDCGWWMVAIIYHRYSLIRPPSRPSYMHKYTHTHTHINELIHPDIHPANGCLAAITPPSNIPALYSDIPALWNDIPALSSDIPALSSVPSIQRFSDTSENILLI